MPHQCTECGRTFADGSKEMLSGCPDCGGNKFQFAPASAVDDGGSGSAGSAGGDTQSTRTRDSGRTNATDTDAADTNADDGRTEWPTHGDEPEAAERSKPVSPTEAGNYSRESSNPDTDATNVGANATDAAGRSAADAADADVDAATDADATADTDSGADRETTEFVDSEATTAEDSAQASARSDVVSPDELSVANRNAESGAANAPGAAPDETKGDADANPPPGPEQDGDPDHERPELEDLREELNDQFESIRIVSPGKYELNLMELYDRQEYIISLQEDGRYVIEMPNSIEDRSE